jgi:hypothetical protein
MQHRPTGSVFVAFSQIRISSTCMTKRLSQFGAFSIVICLIGALGLRHDSGRASQRLGEFEAQRQVNHWHLFGWELYAHDCVGVFPSYTEMDIELGQGLLQQKRFLGYSIGEQDDLLDIGSSNDRNINAFRYILRTKMKSDNPQDRIWIAQKLWAEYYPGHREDVESLLNDPDEQVRIPVKKKLAYLDDPNRFNRPGR